MHVIESAWSEWRYHSEQAKLAAHAAESAPFHAYHADRRERAARVIQGYLQRQEAQAMEAAAAEAAAADAAVAAAGAGSSDIEGADAESSAISKRLMRHAEGVSPSLFGVDIPPSLFGVGAEGGNARVCGVHTGGRSVADGPSERYSTNELTLIRHAQRAFRAHLRTQAEEAEEVLDATMKRSLCMRDDEHSRLCDVLRRCKIEGDATDSPLACL